MKSIKIGNGELIHGNVLEVLRAMPSESVDCIITSPPYFGLRKYPSEADIIWGGDPNCEHKFELSEHFTLGQSNKSTTQSPIKGLEKRWKEGLCKKCGAWFGQLGLEPTPEMYVEHLGLILKEIYRVLKPTGTFWLNIGDTYSGSMGKRSGWSYVSNLGKDGTAIFHKASFDLPRKCMLCIPERVLFKCLEIGFIVRNKIVWMKPNHLPGSQKDRLTNAYEFVYLLVKKPKGYYFNLDAIREPLSEETLERVKKFLNGGESFDPNKHQVLQRLALSFNYQVREAKKGHFGILGVRASEEEMEKYDKQGRLMIKGENGKYKDSEFHSPGSRSWYIIWKRKLPKPEEIYEYLNYWRKKRGFSISEIKKLFDDKGDKVSHWFTPPDLKHGFAYPSKEDWLKLKEILKFDDKYDKVMTEEYPFISTDKGSFEFKSYLKKHDIAVGRVGDFSYTDPLHTKPEHPLGRNPGDVWLLTTEPFPDAHFAIFPVKLVVRCLVAGSPPDGVVLDPFMGSGTVGLACELLNHRMWDKIPKFEEICNAEVVKSMDWKLKWMGIDIVSDYINMAKRRIEEKVFSKTKTLYSFSGEK